MDDKTCAAHGDVKLRCTVHDGQKSWQGVASNAETPAATTCPLSSVPWRKQIACDASGTLGSRCYSTTLPLGKEAAVCILPSQPGSDMKLTKVGREALMRPLPVSFDHPIAETQLAKFTPCMVHPFSEMENAAMVTYVGRGDRTTCTSMVSEAQNVCVSSGKSEDECNKSIKSVYTHEGDSRYTCALDTRRLPVAHDRDQREWWRWTRHTQYECRKDGWRCDDAGLTEYKGGNECSKDSECSADIEVGVCDFKLGTCLTGSTKGSRCSAHEDCDHISGVDGKCSSGRCATGKTGISATYFAPRECTNDAPKHSLNTYCGEHTTKEGGVKYTGVCARFASGGKQYSGCKPFESSRDIQNTMHEELDWQSQHAHSKNFQQSAPKWERLEVCPEEYASVINGRRICRLTTRSIPLVDASAVHAPDSTSARKLCNTNACSKTNCPIGLCTRTANGCTAADMAHIAVTHAK